MVSLVIITFFVQIRYGHVFTVNSQKKLAIRVLTVYLLTLMVSALMLYAIDRLPAFTEPLVAIKRTVLVAFPAVFAATVVDSLHGN